MEIKIRRIKKNDAGMISQIIKDNFLNIDIGGHTKKGIELQIAGNSPENIVKRSENIKYFIARDNNKIIGICGFDRNKIHTLFVDINYQKKGIGSQLLTRILKEAENDGLNSIKTWSTFYAEKFYNSFGFVKKKEIYLPEGKKDIILIEMEKVF